AADHAVDVGCRIVVLDIGIACERINKLVEGNRLRLLDLLLSTVADEDRVAAPFDGDALPFGDGGEIDVNRGKRQDRGVAVHLVNERPGDEGSAPGTDGTCCDIEKVAPVCSGMFRC